MRRGGYLGGSTLWTNADLTWDRAGTPEGQSLKSIRLGSNANATLRSLGNQLGEIEIKIADCIKWRGIHAGSDYREALRQAYARQAATEEALGIARASKRPGEADRMLDQMVAERAIEDDVMFLALNDEREKVESYIDQFAEDTNEITSYLKHPLDSAIEERRRVCAKARRPSKLRSNT